MGTLTSDEKVEKQTKSYVPMTFWETMEFNRMFASPILLLVVAVLGGMAAAYGAWGSPVQIGMAMFPAMAFLAASLVIAPMRIIIGIFVLSLVMDLLVMVC